mmetsp:Transcript_7489/g.12411  ORF Transcript_7489/g.12411 Transcript_7489/m.12411 type:complete len:1519 (-) Transcript_7489:40-4596(-)
MADSPPSVRMLGNVTARIPSDLVDISASQRPEEQDAIERTGSTSINGERNMSISMTSEDGGNESSSAKRNLHPSIMHKPKVESASGEALSEKEQIISRNDKLHQFEISEEIKDSLVAQQNIYNEGEADETSQLRSIDESSENNATQAQENEENNTFIDSFEAKIAEITASLPPNSDVVLSLNDQHYKSVMWLHYKELGRNRDSAREAESADQVFQLFQQHMGTGKFYKLSPFGEKILVSEKIAYDKIIADVRRRLVSYKHWSIGMEGTEKKKKPLSAPIVRKKRERPIENNSHSEELIAPTSPRRSTRPRNAPENLPQQKIMRTNYGSSGPADNDIVLSLNDERYREVMWKHFRLLGAKTPGDNSREEEIGNRLFQWFKTGLRRGGHFYKKEPRGDEIYKVDDDLALRKIIRDLKRRMESSHKWYNHENGAAELEKLLGGSGDVRSDNTYQTNTLLTTSNTSSQLKPIVVQNSLADLLDASHLGKRLPPINSLSTVRAIQTPNELIQTLLLASHKLNELNGTSSKHRKQLRLYELREFSAVCGLNPSIHKDIPTLAELAEYMETTSKSLRKWFRMYKKALTRRFDFKSFGDDRIRDHYDVFYGSDYYQFSRDAEIEIERFFEYTGKSIMQDYDCGAVQQSNERSIEMEASYNDGTNIFNKSTLEQISGERPSRKAVMRTIQEEIDHRPISSDGESVFQRHFLRNQARLQSIPGCSFTLYPKVKRIEKGQKIRTICMVDRCEKQAQTKCDGCCTAHYRALSSVPYEKNVGCESVTAESMEYTTEEKKTENPASPSSDRGEEVQDVEEIDLDRLLPGSRIYVEWNGDDTLYKATVKKVMLDRNEPTLKIHYDGKKRHILDSVPFNMVKGFIAGENDHTKAAAKRQADTAPTGGEENESGDAPDVENGKKARLDSPGDADDAEVAYINLNNAASDPSVPPQSPLARFSPISRNRERGRSIVLISPISTKPFSICPTKLQPQQLPTSAFIGIRSAQKSTVAVSRASSNGVSDTAKELFAPEPETPKVEMMVEKPQPQPQPQQPESMFQCLKCSADCMYDSRMCSVCFMKSYYVSGQGSTGQQRRDIASGQRKHPSRDTLNQNRPQTTASKQKTLQSKPVICHCPDCEKGDFTIQGMYAHWGRAHNVGKLPWNRVSYSCPFCSLQRKFNSLAAIESHTNSAHPRCELLTPNAPKQSRPSNSVAAPSIDRSLRDRNALAQPSTFASFETAEVYKPPPPEPLKFKKLEYAQLLPDGRKEYPRDLSKVIEMIEEQCKEQEEAVNIALDQRSKLCKSEAINDAKELKEERLAYQRGIRERTRMADQERIEKHRYNERHAELIMRYEYENRNKARDREEIQLNRLCSNPIMISSSKMRSGPQNGAICDDEECQFCREDSTYREHLLLDNEVPEFKLDFATDEALDLQQKVKVLNPTVRTVTDSDFISDKDDGNGDSDGETTITTTNGKKRLNNSRRAASTSNRLRTEEDKLLDLQYTKHNLEFIYKYNRGLIRNAWSEKKDTRGRKPI